MAEKKEETSKVTLSIKKLTDLKSQYEHGLLKDYAKASGEIRKIISDPSMQQAFKSSEYYKKILEQYNSPMKNYQDYFKPLNGMEDYLKKDYSYLAKATERYTSLAKVIGIQSESMAERAKSFEALRGKRTALDYASDISRATASLSKSSFIKDPEKSHKKQFDSIRAAGETIKNQAFIKQTQYNDINMEIAMSMNKKVAEKEKREKAVVENSQTQIDKLESISQYMIRQTENLELQNEILKEQVENLRLQNEKSENQIEKIEHQNQLMREQQEDNRKTSKYALWTAVASIAIGIFFSYEIYRWQDISDNKNQKELIQAIKSSSSTKEAMELMKKQVGETQELNKLLKKFITTPKKKKIQ